MPRTSLVDSSTRRKSRRLAETNGDANTSNSINISINNSSVVDKQNHDALEADGKVSRTVGLQSSSASVATSFSSVSPCNTQDEDMPVATTAPVNSARSSAAPPATKRNTRSRAVLDVYVDDDANVGASSKDRQNKAKAASRKRPKLDLSKVVCASKRSKTASGPSKKLDLNTLVVDRSRLAANHVTPSPNQKQSPPCKTSLFHITPKRLTVQSPMKAVQDEPTMPLGVVNLYPLQQKIHLSCTSCGAYDWRVDATTAAYLKSYGRDYFESLKQREHPVPIPTNSTADEGSNADKDDASASSKTQGSVQSSPASAKSAHSSEKIDKASGGTPTQGRDMVLLNSGAVKASIPHESATGFPNQPDLTPKMRSILVDWIIELSEHFLFEGSTLHLAISLIDNVLACCPLDEDDDDCDGLVSAPKPQQGSEAGTSAGDDIESKTDCMVISRERFQLLGATCTWIACKLEMLAPPKVEDFAYVSDSIYTEDQIKRMERRICKALGFSLCVQTPFPYVYEFLRASNECPDPSCPCLTTPHVWNMAMYLLELGRLPFTPVTQKPSLLAAAAVYLTRVTLGTCSAKPQADVDPQGYWTPTLQHYSGYTKADLKETVETLHRYQMAAEESTLKAVFSKYKLRKYHRAALKTVPLACTLGF